MTSRTLTLISILVALACVATPTALADPSGPPPLQASRYDGRSPDTKDAAFAAHPNSRITYNVAIGYASPPLDATSFDGRSPDTKDAAAAAHTMGAPLTASLDGRSPDTKDAGLAAHQPIKATSGSTAFAWNDAGIGAGITLAVLAILATSLGVVRSRGRLSLPF